jgi:hypothetical protein
MRTHLAERGGKERGKQTQSEIGRSRGEKGRKIFGEDVVGSDAFLAIRETDKTQQK